VGRCATLLKTGWSQPSSYSNGPGVYAGTGTISTSDEREKTSVRPLLAAQLAAGSQIADEIGVFNWLESIEINGEAARDHVGLTVQRAIQIFEENGLDPFRLGLACYDKWEQQTLTIPATYEQVEQSDGGTIDGDLIKPEEVVVTLEAGGRHFFRHDQLNMLITASVKSELKAEIKAINERISALETK
jgi:hypothetical protein